MGMKTLGDEESDDSSVVSIMTAAEREKIRTALLATFVNECTTIRGIELTTHVWAFELFV